MVGALLALQKTVVLVRDVPEIGYQVPRAYAVHNRLPELVDIDIEALRPSRVQYDSEQGDANRILSTIAAETGVIVLDPQDLLMDENGKIRIIHDGRFLYSDGDHLSVDGALFVAPVFNGLFSVPIAEE